MLCFNIAFHFYVDDTELYFSYVNITEIYTALKVFLIF